MRRETILECGCIVITINANIVDFKFNCVPHRAMLDGALEIRDQMIEDMVFNGELNWDEKKSQK